LELLENGHGELDAEDLRLCRDTAHRPAPFLDDPGEAQPLHGDAHPGNLPASRDGLPWIDFEDVCRGPVEWDLATVMDVAAVGRLHRPDHERLARCTERALQVALALAVFSDEFGDREGWFPAIQSMLEML
jgi:Ser/Thr protein kinase RdoA (MazF antagonist)